MSPRSPKAIMKALPKSRRSAKPTVNIKVEHPPHYNQHPSGIEAITICEHMTFNVGNAIKYLWRAGKKDGEHTIVDLKKALWYVSREISRVEKAEER